MIVTTRDGKIARTFLVPFGEAFEDSDDKYGIANALRDSKARGLTPLTSPQLLDLRLDCPNIKDPLWSNEYTTTSGVYVVGSDVYVVHGLNHPLTDHERLRGVIDGEFVSYKAKLTQLFSGRQIQGLWSRSYDEFLRETKSKDLTDGQFGVVVKASILRDLPNEDMKLSTWVNDPRAVMLAGGKRRAEAYAEFLNENRIKKSYLNLDAQEGNYDRSNFVLVNGDYNYGLNGNSNIYNTGRFVVLMPKAQSSVAQNSGDGSQKMPLENRVR